jgi:hypothetical protein
LLTVFALCPFLWPAFSENNAKVKCSSCNSNFVACRLMFDRPSLAVAACRRYHEAASCRRVGIAIKKTL